MNKLVSIEKSVLLIGESRDEELFFSALVRHLGLSDLIQVAQYGGTPKLAAFLADLQTQTTFPIIRVIGITRDADVKYDAALTSVNAVIQQANFPNTVQVVPFVLPKENSSGALEALVLDAVSSAPAWPCVERFMECVASNDTTPLSLTETDKRHIHAWLSTLPDPELRLGEAAQKKYVPFDRPAFQPLTNFVKSLVSATEDGIPHV